MMFLRLNTTNLRYFSRGNKCSEYRGWMGSKNECQRRREMGEKKHTQKKK